jgi:low affinity Fe/Cu permease
MDQEELEWLASRKETDVRKYLFSLIGSEHRARGAYARFAEKTATVCGRSGVFTIACAVIAVWLVSGPLFSFSDTWQLIINTGTTIVTFLMMFLLQNSHNRDIDAMHKKLDALLVEIGHLSKNDR